MIKRKNRLLPLLLALCLMLSCAACGGEGEAQGPEGPAESGRDNGVEQSGIPEDDDPPETGDALEEGDSLEAASMWLVRTEGAVAVTDDQGADVTATGRLGLYSGYGVATQAASFGWIDLDETKLTKMDENSGVSVQKDGKKLELTVNSGSLFFNITRPLEEDEELTIRSSTMVMAIRGTCGWVEAPDAEHMNVYILEGTVECTVGDETAPVGPKSAACLSLAEGEKPIVSRYFFTVADVPEFVLAELGEDDPLIDRLPGPPATMEGPGGEYRFDGPVLYTVPAGALTDLGVFIPRGLSEIPVVLAHTKVTAPEGLILGDVEIAQFFNDGDGYYTRDVEKSFTDKSEYVLADYGRVYCFFYGTEDRLNVGAVAFVTVDPDQDPELSAFVAGLAS